MSASVPTRRLRALLASSAAFVAAACAPLTMFATLTPRDPAARPATGVAYGEGPRRQLDVYVPRHGAKAAAPVAVFFYGGSWDSGRRQDYGWVGRALAAKGFVTLVPDYRVAPEVEYPGFLQDGAQAVRWAVDHAAAYGGDPNRIVLVGHSAGAYNAVMLALDPAYLRAAGVDPARIKAVAGLSGPYDFLPLDGPITRRTFGAAADLPATQPLNYVSKASPPAFLATGDADTFVLPRNTRKLSAMLRDAGVAVEERHYAGVDHAGTVLALSRPFRSKAPVLEEMTGFLSTHAQ
jgi:acetyl esterase/lipase